MKRTSRMTKALLGGGLGLVLGLTLVFVSAHQALAQQGTWETSEGADPTLTPMLTPRTCFPAAGAINDELFVAGGCQTAVLEVYDPAKESGPSGPTPWASKPSDPFERPGAAAAVANNKLYVVGGCLNTDCTTNVFGDPGSATRGTLALLEVFDPVANSWTKLAPMPTPRATLAFEEIGGKLYAVGGINWQSQFKNTVEVFDPNPPDNDPLGSWSTLAPMPTARAQLAAGVINGKLYVVGGANTPSGIVDTLEVFDPNDGALGSWSTLTPMSTPKTGIAAGVIDGRLYVVGGNDFTDIVDTVEVYDPATDIWSTATPMPTARQRLAAAVIGGKLYAVGGDDGVNALDTLEVFDPTAVTNCVQPPSGLVSWWPGDGNADDIVGSNNGTLLNGATFSTGQVGQAFIFDGVDDFVVVPDSADQKPPSITIDGWFNLAQAPVFGEFYLASKYQPPGIFVGWIIRIDSTLRPTFSIHRSPNFQAHAVSLDAISLNTWVHIAGTYDGTTVHIYVDGELTGSDTLSGGYTPASTPMKIGTATWFTGGFMPGLADEVEIYNRTLSAAEIEAIFDAGSAGKCKTNILVEPLSHDFGQVNAFTSEDAIVTISNTGGEDLTVNDVAVTAGASSFFVADVDPAGFPPFTLLPGDDVFVTVTFFPTSEGVHVGTLTVDSDDPDEPIVEVSLIGNGLVGAVEEQATVLEAAVDDAIAFGGLVGSGSGKSSTGRLGAFANMIEAAGDLIEAGFIADACGQLRSALRRVDGVPKPPDFVVGDDAALIADQIPFLRDSLGCN